MYVRDLPLSSTFELVGSLLTMDADVCRSIQSANDYPLSSRRYRLPPIDPHLLMSGF